METGTLDFLPTASYLSVAGELVSLVELQVNWIALPQSGHALNFQCNLRAVDLPISKGWSPRKINPGDRGVISSCALCLKSDSST